MVAKLDFGDALQVRAAAYDRQARMSSSASSGVVGHDLLGRQAPRQPAEHVANADAQVTHAGSTATALWVNGDQGNAHDGIVAQRFMPYNQDAEVRRQPYFAASCGSCSNPSNATKSSCVN